MWYLPQKNLKGDVEKLAALELKSTSLFQTPQGHVLARTSEKALVATELISAITMLK